MKAKNFVLLQSGWIFIVIISFVWNYFTVKESTLKLVEDKAISFFNQIEIVRFWNAEHGGLYAPINEKTIPNLYLNDSLRDITTIEGMKLTKINPAYMTRQIGEINKSNLDLKLHLTSLNPIRPENKADEWETKALRSFEKNNLSILELVESDSLSQFKYMAPLFVKEPCLKCHEKQGYKLGDIRGGLSISIPAKPYFESQKRQTSVLLFAHVFVLVIGITGIFYSQKKGLKYLSAIQQKNVELENNKVILKQTADNLLQSNAKKDKFFSIIAHDLRNPFLSLIGLSEILLEEKDDCDKREFEKLLLHLNTTSVQTFQLLENLLKWSLSEMDKISFDPEVVDLRIIVENNIKVVQSSASNKKILFINNILKSIMVKVDKNMIDTVFRNLFTNAIKFSNEGDKVEIFADKGKDLVTVTVQDHGIGMSEQQIEDLFILGESKTTLGTQKEKGTGLGLVLCHEFVKKHQGKIWVESEINKGSKFMFSIPIETSNS